MTAKKIILPVLVFSAFLIGATVYSTKVRADDVSNHPFIERLTERFNLNKDDVDVFMEETMQERQQERQQESEKGLQQAVDDGVITSEQKDAISAKHQEVAGQRQQNREEMDQWFADQGIDHDAISKYLRPDKGVGMRMGEGRGMHNSK
jgi:hypothetical protein